ncbi:MAG: MaoC/PaaZ C-terminal domain-containing protein [Alphaproteobacteria bacterium]
MTIDYKKLLAWEIPTVEHHYTKKDTILYALGVGYGYLPIDRRQLRFVYESDLLPTPTLPLVLGYPGLWMKNPGTGIDVVKVVQGEQRIVLYKPIPVEATVIGRSRVTAIVDKGKGKGALVYTERDVIDKDNDELLCTLSSTTFCRNDGGFGGPDGPVKKPHAVPERPADEVCEIPTLDQAALIYRLSGDFNPLHVDPDTAQAAGFERPILHGMASFGVVAHAIMKTYCFYEPHGLRSMEARFSAPIYPGETIRTEMWCDGSIVSFRASSLEREVLVLNNGRAEITGEIPGS